MNIIKTLLIAILVFAHVTSGKSFFRYQYPGTNLRGKILTVNYYNQQIPLVSAKVDLFVFDANYNQWRILASVYSDAYGFFYFQLVPVGYYSIQVNQAKNYNIQVVPINYSIYQYQDLPLFYY
jgi:hypothetical protein